MKAYFLPRCIAHIIDIIIIVTISALFMLIIPTNHNIEELQKESSELQKKYIAKDISSSEYIEQSKAITYDYQKANVPFAIIDIVLSIGYFVIFQYRNNGQTFGKKLMKVKIVSVNDEELTLNYFVYRALLLQSILVNLILIGAVLFISKNYYFYTDMTLTTIQSLLIIITVGMVLFREDGRGIHDMISKTKVVMIEKEGN